MAYLDGAHVLLSQRQEEYQRQKDLVRQEADLGTNV